MSDDQKRIELTRMVLGKDWEPRAQYPATLHNRRRHDDACVDPNAGSVEVEQPEPVKRGQGLLGRLVALFRGNGSAPN